MRNFKVEYPSLEEEMDTLGYDISEFEMSVVNINRTCKVCTPLRSLHDIHFHNLLKLNSRKTVDVLLNGIFWGVGLIL
jgi:hypothetical protein